MKVLIISTFDFNGGAARAAYRLHCGLRKFGVDSNMLVRQKSDDNPNIFSPNKNIPSQTIANLRYLLDKFPLRKYKNRENVIFSTATTGDKVIKMVQKIKPDIVHLHWFNRGFMHLKDFSSLGVPVVWSMHDMWPFTGGCHYDMFCKKYETECGSCPILKSAKQHDTSYKIFKSKESAYSKKNDITFIGLSKWLQKSAKESTLLKSKNVLNLPNPIDTNIYKPVAKNIAREIWNFNLNKKTILFGAMDATGDKRKGFEHLLSALKKLDLSGCQIKVVGSTRVNSALDLDCDISYLGNINDDVSMALLYSASDVVIVPSEQENLSNVIMESLSCGTSVVAFDIGGNSDMIKHKENGYLAKPYDAGDLAQGISFVLSQTSDNLSVNARNFVITNFSENVVIPRYLELYNEIVKK